MKKRKIKKLMKRAEAKGVDKLSYRGFALRAGSPESVDDEGRSVEAIIATEEPTEVFDFERYEVIKEVLLIDGVEMPGNRQVPLLDTHRRFDTANVLGSIRELKKDGQNLVGRAHFSAVENVQDIWTKVREGHLTDFSAGYRPIDSQWIPEGETYTFKGRSFAGPVRVTKRWRIREGSIVPIGADEFAKARALNVNQKNEPEGGNMNKKTKAFLIKRGLAEDATEAEAWAFLETLDVREIPKDVKPDVKPDDKKDKAPKVDVETIRSEARGDERKRIVEIDALGKRWDNAELSNQLIVDGKTVADAYRAFESFIATQREDDFKHYGPATIGADAQDKFRAAASDALLARSGVTYDPEVWADGHKELMGYSMRELAREALRIGNLDVTGNPMEMVGRALATSDLPLILANVANKSLFAGWDTAPETWRSWCGTTQVSDFKTHSLPRPSEFSDLEEIPESGEYRYGKVTEGQEQYAVVTFGKLFAITRQTIINDDLGAISRFLQAQGEAASRKIGDVVYSVLTANAAMGDGIALFDTNTHLNYVGNTSGGVPGQATISEGIRAMKMQKDLQGLRRLNIRPEHFIAPVALEGLSEIFFQTIQFSDNATIATDSTFASTRKNLYAGSYFNRVYEPRLDDNDPAAWFLAGPKGKTVDVIFLNGNEQPYLEQKQGWNVDGTEFKVRIDVNAKAVDWKGLYQNDGN